MATLIIDASNFYWRNFLELDKPTAVGDGKSISNSTLYQLNKSLIRIEREFQPDFVYFLFDNPMTRVNFRKSIDPGYKSNREKKPSFAYDTLDLWKSMLKFSSDKYRVCYKTGYEADDLVFPLLKFITGDAVLISADLDWARSISSNVSWYDFKEVYDRHKFKDKYGFDPTGNSIKMYKAFRGDVSDCIPVGCPRIPENLLLQIVQTFSSVAVFYSDLQSVSWIKDEWKLKFLECKPRVVLNYKLVDFMDENLDAKSFITECTSEPLKLDALKLENKMVTNLLLW